MIDFVRMCSKLNIPHLDGQGHHHCKPGWVNIHCPKCSGGRGGWHLGYSKSGGGFNCWRCGKMKFWYVMPLLLKVDPSRLRALIAEFETGSIRSRLKTEERRPEAISPPFGTVPLLDLVPCCDYLSHRGFDPVKLAEEWGVMACNMFGESWAWRIVIPVRDETGFVVAYQGRAIGDVKPKYKFSDNKDCVVDPKHLIYGLDRVPGGDVLIVEGCPLVWKFGPGTVGTFGIDWTVEQANKLRIYDRKYLLFDPEPKAQMKALELAHHLSLFPGETEIISGFPGDLDSLTPEQVADLRKELRL